MSDSESDSEVTKSTGTSRRANTSSPEKRFTGYAICIKSHSPTTKEQLQLEEGDVLVGIRNLYGRKFKIWEGENKRTGQTGTFNEDVVQFHEGSPPKKPNASRTRPHTTAGEVNQSNLTTTILICIFIGIVVSYVSGVHKSLLKRSRNPANITELEGTFKSQDPDVWDTLRAGLLPSKTELVKTFLFVHAKDGPTTECLIKKISDNYCTVYRAGELNFADDFVSRAKSTLQELKCMVIYDLENLPAEGITVLKGFCDAYTPIVPKAEFYFALDTGEPPVGSNVKKVARQKLETLWSEKYSHDDFGGTVTRLTQNVLRVTGEDELPC